MPLAPLIAAALAAFFRSLGVWIAGLLSSLAGQAFLGGIVALIISYFATTKIDAVSLLGNFFSSGTGGVSMSFSTMGTIISALRFDDVILVYLNAYATGYIFRVFANLGVSRRLPGPGTTPQLPGS